MTLDFQLSEFEQVSSIILIGGFILLIISAEQAQQEIMREQSGINISPPAENSAGTAAVASWIQLIGISILAIIAYIRLKERAVRIQTGMEKGSLLPNINITIGTFIAAAGLILIAIGAQQRADEVGARFTII